MKYFAHRGLSSIHKDNSIASIRAAILDYNYTGVEIDVQLSRDNVIVLCHDLYLGEKFIKDLEYKELAELNVISLNHLYETVDISDMNILIDIKGTNENIVNELYKFYMDYDYDRVIFCSFNRKIANKLPPCFNRGIIFESIFSETEYEKMTSGFQVVVIHWTCLCSDLILYCRSKKIKTFTYTHKEKMELEYMKKFEVDFIITNGI